MSNWNLVWLQPKLTPSSDHAAQHQMALQQTFLTQNSPLGVSKEEQERAVEHLRRPTRSSLAKQDSAEVKRLHIPTFLDNERHSWSKMNYFQDCHRCLWTNQGKIKQGKKI